MKAIFLLSLAVALVSALLTDEEEWQHFKILHKKLYGSDEEEAHRFGVFKNNLEKIREHNQEFERGETTWKMGVNQFTDMTEEEFQATLKGILPLTDDKQKHY